MSWKWVLSHPDCTVSGRENEWVSLGGLVCSSGTMCQSELGAEPQYDIRSLSGSDAPRPQHPHISL